MSSLKIIERWLPLLDYEGNEVSNLGRVRTIDRVVPHSRHGFIKRRGVIRKTWTDRDGYICVSIYCRGRGFYRKVHRLVASAWLGECHLGCEVNHKNGDKIDNRPENLEYVTHGENVTHATKTRLMLVGERHGRAKLTKEQVVGIRDRLAAGETMQSISNDHDVCQATISHIKSGINWKAVANAV